MHLIVGLAIAFVLVALMARTRKTTRNCRWRADRSGDAQGKHLYKCAYCGAEAFVDRDVAPNTCLLKK
ncbi:MAG: hypothetical protein AAF754_08850 [Pseudomonadota bacterium]